MDQEGEEEFIKGMKLLLVWAKRLLLGQGKFRKKADQCQEVPVEKEHLLEVY